MILADMTEISLWQLTLEPPGQILDPERLATNLFLNSVHILNELTKNGEMDFSPAMIQRLNHQKHSYKLWCSDLDAREGGLDDKLVGTSHVKGTLLRILRRMAEALVVMAQQTSLAEGLVDVFQQIEELNFQVSQVIDKSAIDEDENKYRALSSSAISFPEINLDDLSSSESESSSQEDVFKIEEAAGDIELSNDLLCQLGPALHDCADRAAAKREKLGVTSS